MVQAPRHQGITFIEHLLHSGHSMLSGSFNLHLTERRNGSLPEVMTCCPFTTWPPASLQKWLSSSL